MATEKEYQALIDSLSGECERLHKVINNIRDDIEREADYQDAYVNADVAEGMYMAMEIIDKQAK